MTEYRTVEEAAYVEMLHRQPLFMHIRSACVNISL